MKNCVSVLFLILGLFVASQAYDVRCPYPYKYNILALSWLGEFCSENDCNSNYDKWDHKTITIHGFWPSPNPKNDRPAIEYDLCRKSNPADCERNEPMAFEVFGYDYLTSNETGLKEDLATYWPETNANRDQGWFYQHEWDKHGVCYLMHMINTNTKAYEKDPVAFSQYIFKEYFRIAIQHTKDLNLQFHKNQEFTDKDNLSNYIGISGPDFTYQCNGKETNDREINEVRVCFSVAKTPGKEVVTDCDGYENDQCRISKDTDEFRFK